MGAAEALGPVTMQAGLTTLLAPAEAAPAVAAAVAVVALETLLNNDHSALIARLHNVATASGRRRRPVQFSSAAPAGLVKVVSGLKPPHLCAVKGAAKALDWTGRGTLCA